MTGDPVLGLENADEVEADPFAAFEEWTSETDRKAFAELAANPDADAPDSP